MSAAPKSKPIILHIGDPIQYNIETYNRLASQFTIIRPSVEERQRDAFIKAIKEKKWGDFDAICRPFWNSGGEMGRWDRELVPLLPASVKVFASAGAGYDWADVDVLAEYGKFCRISEPIYIFMSFICLHLRHSLLQRCSSILRSSRRHGHLPHPQRIPQSQVVSHRGPFW